MGTAAPAVQAIVAADAGANIFLASFARFVDPGRVSHRLPPHQHIIAFAFGNEPVGKSRAADGAHDAHRDFDPRLFQCFSRVRVVRVGYKAGGMHLWPGKGVQASSAGDMDHVDFILKQQGL